MPLTPEQKLAKYYPPMTPAELDAARDASRESTIAFADKVEARANLLLQRWIDYATAKWGPNGFSSSVTDKEKAEFTADKNTYGAYRDWLMVGNPPTTLAWRDTYAEIKGSSVEQYLPGYWKGAWIRVYGSDHDVSYYNGELDEWVAAHPPKKPAPPTPEPPKPEPPKPEPPVPDDVPISQASVGGSNGWVWGTAAAVAAFWWLKSRRR